MRKSRCREVKSPKLLRTKPQITSTYSVPKADILLETISIVELNSRIKKGSGCHWREMVLRDEAQKSRYHLEPLLKHDYSASNTDHVMSDDATYSFTRHFSSKSYSFLLM